MRDRLHRVGLRVTDEPDRTALYPAGRVQRRDPDGRGIGPSVAIDAALDVRDDAAHRVERGIDDPRAVVADRAVDRLHGDVAQLAGAAHGPVRIRGGPLEADALDAIIAQDGDGRVPEVQVQAAARAGRPARAPRLERAQDDLQLVAGAGGELELGEVLVVHRTMSTSGTSPSSRSSIGVNFISSGPRRPKTCTSVTAEASSPASTLSASRSSAGRRRAWRAPGRRRARRCRCR